MGITHLIEKNDYPDGSGVGAQFPYREFYWEQSRHRDGAMLRIAGYREKPIIAPRWEVTGNDTYGHSPTMDALPEIKQLQVQTKQKSHAVDKMIRPPIVADMALQSATDCAAARRDIIRSLCLDDRREAHLHGQPAAAGHDAG